MKESFKTLLIALPCVVYTCNIHAKMNVNQIGKLIKTTTDAGKEAIKTTNTLIDHGAKNAAIKAFNDFNFSEYTKFINIAKEQHTNYIKPTPNELIKELMQIINKSQHVQTETTFWSEVFNSSPNASTQNTDSELTSFCIIKSICNNLNFPLKSITYDIEPQNTWNSLTSNIRINPKNAKYTLGYAFELIHISQYFAQQTRYMGNEKTEAINLINNSAKMIHALTLLNEYIATNQFIYNNTLCNLCNNLIHELKSCMEAIAPHRYPLHKINDKIDEDVITLPYWLRLILQQHNSNQL